VKSTTVRQDLETSEVKSSWEVHIFTIFNLYCYTGGRGGGGKGCGRLGLRFEAFCKECVFREIKKRENRK
jgi:hypothetical protein